MGYLSQFAGKVKTDNKQSGFLSQYSNYNSPENIAKRKKQKEEELKRKQEEQKRAQLQLQPSTSLPTGKSVSQQQLTNKFVSSVPQTYQAQQLQGKGQPVTTEEQRQQQEYQQKTPAIQQSVGKNLKDLAKSSILQISSFLWNAPDVAIKNVLYRDAQNLKIAKNVADVAVNPANAPVVIVKEIAKKLSGNDKKKETGILSELKDKLRTDYENWKSKSSSGQVYTGVQTELKRQQEEAGYKTSDEYNQASLKDKLTKHFGETLLTVLGGTIPSIAPYFVNAGFGQSAMFVNTNQDIYDDAIKGGVDKEKATKLATTTATVISLLDSIVPDEVMGKNVKEKFISGFIKKIANLGLTSGKEAATEITQEIAQMLAEKTYREVTGKEAIDRTVMSGIGGLLGGIGFGGIDLAFNTAADVSQESKPQLETQVEVNKMPQNQDLQQQEVEQQKEAKPPETVKTEEELAREYIKGRATKLREERKYDISWTDKKGKKHKIKDVEYADAQGWVSNLDKQGISPLVTKVSETKYRLEEEPKTEEGDLISEAKKYKSAEEFVKAQTPRVGGIAPELQGQTLYRGMSEGEWQAIQAGRTSGKASKGGRTFLTTEKQTADMAVEAGKGNGVVVELKPETGQKVISGGKIGENTGGNLPGEYQAMNIGIDDIAKVTDKNGKVIYEATTGGKTKSQLTDIWNKANQEKYRLKDDFQKATGVDLTDSQEAKIIDLNKRIFGDDDVKITAQILTPSGQKALGSYRDGMIKILNGKADATDTYLHEAVHKYFDIFLTEDEQVNLLLSAKKEFGGKDFAEVEENLAENFINYAKNKELNNKEIKTLFDKIIFRIKRYFKNEDMITKFYNDIIEGKAKKEKQVQKKIEGIKTQKEYVSKISKDLLEKYDNNKFFESLKDTIERKTASYFKTQTEIERKNIVIDFVSSQTYNVISSKYKKLDPEEAVKSYQEYSKKNRTVALDEIGNYLLENKQITEQQASSPEEIMRYIADIAGKEEININLAEKERLDRLIEVNEYGYLTINKPKNDADRDFIKSFLEEAERESGIDSNGLIDKFLDEYKQSGLYKKEVRPEEEDRGYLDSAIGRGVDKTIASEKNVVLDKQKVSKNYKRFKEFFGIEDDNIKYTKGNFDKWKQQAENLIAKNQEKAYRIAYGLESAPKDFNEMIIAVTVADALTTQGEFELANEVRKRASLMATKAGQIVVASKFGIGEDIRIQKRIAQSRLEKLGKALKATDLEAALVAQKEVNRRARKAKEQIDNEIKNNNKSDVANMESLLKEIIC